MYADHRAVQRGTVQHEVLEGSNAVAFHDGDSIVIKVNCRADAGDITEPIRYGLAVTLELAEDISIPLVRLPIYQEVRERLVVRIPVQGCKFWMTTVLKSRLAHSPVAAILGDGPVP